MAERTMAKLASKSAVDRSPGLKSQVSAEGNSDVENMDDPIVSQMTFGTQIPYSPPKPAEKSSPRKTQSLGKRKVMADLRHLVNDTNRAQKKIKFCIENKKPTNTYTMLAGDGQGDVPTTSVEHQPKKRDAESGPKDLGRPTKGEPPSQNLSRGKERPNISQASLTRVTSVTTSTSRLSDPDYQCNLLSRLRDQLPKTTYLPRYLQVISKAQNDLLATDAKWQPALVGQPTRPGTLPLELITCLTAAADQEAALECRPIQSNQRAPGSLQDFSEGQAGNIDEELDLPSNSPILKSAPQAYDQIQSEEQEVESESEGSITEWSISPLRSSPPRQILPPDSSPMLASSNMLVPSRAAEAPSCESRKMEDPVPLSHSQRSSVNEVEKSSQASPHHSNHVEGSLHIQVANTEISQGKPAPRPLTTAAGAYMSQEDTRSTAGTNYKSSGVEFVTKTTQSPAFMSPSNDSTQHLELSKPSNVQISHTPRIPGMASSSPPQTPSSQVSNSLVTSLQRQPASQQIPKCPSPRPIPRTFLYGIGDSWPIGTPQGESQPNASMECFEIESSEDERMPDANLSKSLPSQSRDDQADVSQQIMTEIQNASQILSLVPSNPENPDDRETAHPNHDVSSNEAIPEDGVIFASDSTSSAKRKLNNADKKELSNHPKHAKPSSVLSVSSEDHDFWRVDNMTGIYRRGSFSSLRTNATPLSPSTCLGSNISPQSASVQSSDRRQSDRISVSSKITTSASLPSMPAQGEKILVKRPTSTSGMSRRRALQPENQFLVFKQSYPTYKGNLTQFLRSCIMIKKIRAAGKMLPQCVWDDFVHRHHHDYRSYLLDVYKSDELESPMPYEEYYADCVSEPLHVKGIVRLAFIDSLNLNADPKTTLDTPPIGPMHQLDHLEDSGRSVAASSLASNVQAKEPLPETADKIIPKNTSTTLESQLQLQGREKTPQSQSSVHLWLQKASGAASPELGTSDRLVAPDSVPCIDLTDDLTENDADFTFDLAQELLPLTNPFAGVWRGAPEASVEELRLPSAKTEPFKHFALEYAKLDVKEHEKLEIQAETEGGRQTNVQRVIDIFTWRA